MAQALAMRGAAGNGLDLFLSIGSARGARLGDRGAAGFRWCIPRVPRLRRIHGGSATIRARVGRSVLSSNKMDTSAKINLDGTGFIHSKTGIGLIDYMIATSFRAPFDIRLTASIHDTEDENVLSFDIARCFGSALKQALCKNRHDMQRYGFASVPVDDALIQVSIDLAGKTSFGHNIEVAEEISIVTYTTTMAMEWFQCVSYTAGIGLNIHQVSGVKGDSVVEAAFLAFGEALAQATATRPLERIVPTDFLGD